MTAPTKEQIKAMADAAEARSRGEGNAKEILKVALSEGEIDAEIRKLAELPESVYETSRKAALERLGEGWRGSVLDRLVKAARKKKEGDDGQGRTVLIADLKLWDDPVDGNTLATALR